ncbi:putative ferric iron reductase protein [Bacillus freudenreichii]|nr:putative ferric iron reductase protein [Bacillus freudenreichii]
MSQNRLSHQETQKLMEYRLAVADAGQSVGYASLLDPKRLPDFLAWLTGRIGAPNACVTSSILIKRMGFYAVIHLYALTVLDKKLNVDLRELKLVDHSNAELWLPDFFLGDVDVQEPSEDRNEWRAAVLEDLFAHCITPLVQLLKEQTRLSEKVMWENIAIYIHWIYEKLMVGELHIRAKADYRYLFHEAPGKLFGPYRENPLSPFSKRAGAARKTCCLSYMLRKQEKGTCSTCPLGACK